ncbi:hypothetical protein Pelo_18499 [Pelomyxa schiedti]|nr:hypothetical protein Pelo_18499 [Pelomyxa schiedti]
MGSSLTTNFDNTHDEPDELNNVRLSGPLPEGKVGVPYNGSIALEQNVVRECAVYRGELPPGLNLRWAEFDHGVGVTGTPTAKGQFTFRVRVDCMATNGCNGGCREYTVSVTE